MPEKTIIADDGMPADEVGRWSKEKHECLIRYLDISRAARKKFLGDGKAGATYIDLFCASGKSKIRETGEWIDGSAIAAWKQSQQGGSPFSGVYIADLDSVRREAAVTRLHKLNAPVYEVSGSALEAAQTVTKLVNPYGLHLAFLDPFSLGSLDFRIIETLAHLKRIDILIHLSAMDLQRNLGTNLHSADSAFDLFAPGWREKIKINSSQGQLRNDIVEYWRTLVGNLGVWPSTEMRLVRGSRHQPLYWLLLASRYGLAHKFWQTASNLERQTSLF